MNLLKVLEEIVNIPGKYKHANVHVIHYPDIVSAKSEIKKFCLDERQENREVFYSYFSPGYDELRTQLERSMDNNHSTVIILSPKSATADAGFLNLITQHAKFISNKNVIYVTPNAQIAREFAPIIEFKEPDDSPSEIGKKAIDAILRGAGTAMRYRDLEERSDIRKLISSVEKVVPPSKLSGRLFAYFNGKSFEKSEDITQELVSFLESLRIEGLNNIQSMGIEKPIDIENVIGIDKIKEWVLKRYDNPLVGETVKAILIVGVPGCGKSMTAKAMGSLLNIPVVRYNPVSSFSSMLGDTEKNIRRDLEIIDSIGKCVVFIDEIEKQLAGSSSSDKSDAGSTSRSIQQIITWMQDRKSDALIVATANSFDTLPKELLRSDRIDEIFFIDLPNENTRIEMFKYYANKFSLPLTGEKNYGKIKFTCLEKLKNFTGSDIKDLLKRFYYDYTGETAKDEPWAVLYRIIDDYRPFAERFPERVEEVVKNKQRYIIV
jgi:hypothetical protein